MLNTSEKNVNNQTNTNVDKTISEIKQNYHKCAEELLLSKASFSKPVQDRLCKIANLPQSTVV